MRERLKGRLAGLAYRLLVVCTLGRISPVLGAGIILEQDGKVLFIQRADGAGYSMPGGIVQAGETLEACVMRETYEETGYTVQITALLGVYSSPGRDPRFPSVAISYAGKITGGSLRTSKEGIPCWLFPSEVAGQMAFDSETILRDYLHGHQSLS